MQRVNTDWGKPSFVISKAVGGRSCTSGRKRLPRATIASRRQLANQLPVDPQTTTKEAIAGLVGISGDPNHSDSGAAGGDHSSTAGQAPPFETDVRLPSISCKVHAADRQFMADLGSTIPAASRIITAPTSRSRGCGQARRDGRPSGEPAQHDVEPQGANGCAVPRLASPGDRLRNLPLLRFRTRSVARPERPPRHHPVGCGKFALRSPTGFSLSAFPKRRRSWVAVNNAPRRAQSRDLGAFRRARRGPRRAFASAVGWLGRVPYPHALAGFADRTRRR